MRRRQRSTAQTRDEALSLLRAGKVSLPELAKILGVSTQTIWNWCREEGVDWRSARMRRVAQEWRKVNT